MKINRDGSPKSTGHHHWRVIIFICLWLGKFVYDSPRKRLWKCSTCTRIIFTITMQVYTNLKIILPKMEAPFDLLSNFNTVISYIFLIFSILFLNLSLSCFSSVEDYTALDIIGKVSRPLLINYQTLVESCPAFSLHLIRKYK